MLDTAPYHIAFSLEEGREEEEEDEGREEEEEGGGRGERREGIGINFGVQSTLASMKMQYIYYNTAHCVNYSTMPYLQFQVSISTPVPFTT